MSWLMHTLVNKATTAQVICWVACGPPLANFPVRLKFYQFSGDQVIIECLFFFFFFNLRTVNGKIQIFYWLILFSLNTEVWMDLDLRWRVFWISLTDRKPVKPLIVRGSIMGPILKKEKKKANFILQVLDIVLRDFCLNHLTESS